MASEECADWGVPARSWHPEVVNEHDGVWFLLLEGVGTGSSRLPPGSKVGQEPEELAAR